MVILQLQAWQLAFGSNLDYKPDTAMLTSNYKDCNCKKALYIIKLI